MVALVAGITPAAPAMALEQAAAARARALDPPQSRALANRLAFARAADQAAGFDQKVSRGGGTVMHGMPRPARRAHASTAADGERPDRRARNATWVPKGVVAGSSIFVVRSRSGTAHRAASAAASAVERVAKAPTWIIQRPGGDTEEKTTGRASWIGRASVAYRVGGLVTGGSSDCAITGACAGGSIGSAVTEVLAGGRHGRVGS